MPRVLTSLYSSSIWDMKSSYFHISLRFDLALTQETIHCAHIQSENPLRTTNQDPVDSLTHSGAVRSIQNAWIRQLRQEPPKNHHTVCSRHDSIIAVLLHEPTLFTETPNVNVQYDEEYASAK